MRRPLVSVFYLHEKSGLEGPDILSIYGYVVNMHGNYITVAGHLLGKTKVIVYRFLD